MTPRIDIDSRIVGNLRCFATALIAMALTRPGPAVLAMSLVASAVADCSYVVRARVRSGRVELTHQGERGDT